MTYHPYSGHATDFYATTSDVADVVNLAVALGRPLLVEGEAGCGKTQLAYSIAVELELPLTKLPIKSSSQAKDLLYRFDALRRLQDAQNPLLTAKASSVYPYISLEPLGLAIQSGEPRVVLIDEVDKADIDFPNDLLDVLDKFSFEIEDLPLEESEASFRARGFGRSVSSGPDAKPIVVITSNREKQLSEPFLRRCIFLELGFPTDEALLANIVRKNIGAGTMQLSDDLIGAAVRKFLEIRERARQVGASQKAPATSELIDWVRVLSWRGSTSEAVEQGRLRPPYWRMLFKTMADLHTYDAQTP
jgi:MoxR-like ATPase